MVSIPLLVVFLSSQACMGLYVMENAPIVKRQAPGMLRMLKREAPEDLKGLTSLALINPWHAAMKLFDSTAVDEDIEEEQELAVDQGLEDGFANVRSRFGFGRFALRNFLSTNDLLHF
eukprot:GFUD01061682.1.p1 GENE.GFUD01061682.1~~GFUD01061682.1.p1  ORF type:complete len:118 (+),score=35.47 GFUD01061682.1:3-356(+)